MSEISNVPESCQDHDERRREFLELCGKMGMAVPPTVMLLASSRNALASHGRVVVGGDTGGDYGGGPSGGSFGGGGAGGTTGASGGGTVIGGGSNGGLGWRGGLGGGDVERGWWFARIVDRVFARLFGF
ncbi:hypothetical protein [Ferruginivarius sediminum]|uniref:Uncharacterized protein n=1 Tax=Ferruginivarius sediminum TaxID=2661937 RepID=A0A369T9E8_9PROT|nr:hypothetical protein [Ferruginivarius sediminum]RDD61492.1 hypothetical protein DRB17_12375 [Ferruginivarius sediminum]